MSKTDIEEEVTSILTDIDKLGNISIARECLSLIMRRT
jgi:hypothetical protein